MTLPASPDLSHLKKQAKQLLRAAAAGDAAALGRFAAALPAQPPLAALRLHDAQSVLAREHGFRSWTELKRYVEWKRTDLAARLKAWLAWVYEGNARERRLAIRMLAEQPDVFASDPWLACAAGDEAAVRRALSDDAAWVNRPGGALGMPPLVAVTHSGLIREEGFAPRLLACAGLLLRHGADVDARWTDPNWPDWPFSALYGAAGRTHHAGMTELLLAAGANPDDNESLYHSVEASDSACTRLLLVAGARVTGTNAIAHVLDYDKLEDLQLMLRHGGDPNERPWLHHAILRGRSLAHVQALVEAGADLRARDGEGISLYRWAQARGRLDVVGMLRAAGIEEPLTQEEEFVAACTRGDDAAARAILERLPDIVARLSPGQLQIMPELAGLGAHAAVRTMLALGWPREVKAGWDATALNLAVFQGDAAMARLLLTAGADWRTPHGYGDTVLGTLSFASQADGVGEPAPRDYPGCARALVEHGVPLAELRRYRFSPEVADYLEALPEPADRPS